MRSDLIQRLLDVVRHTTNDRRRLKELEEETGIPDRNWKQVWSGRQRPTAHMIEALARRWPQYAFWMVTGITDEANGHTAPPDSWTCSQLRSSPDVEETALSYFEAKILAQDLVYGMSSAWDENYVHKRFPSAEEMAAAKARGQTNDAKMQARLDTVFGRETVVLKQKHTDLDEAIAQLAFDKGLMRLKTKFGAQADLFDNNPSALEEVKSELGKTRRLIASDD